MSLANKVAIVTGASSGIGASTAILFAKEGAQVVMVGRNETKLSNVSAQVAKAGKKPLVIKADVSVDSEAKGIIEKTIKSFGKIDILINNAGFARFGTHVEGTITESWDAIVNTNVRAPMLLTSLATPHLIKTKGSVVNISSGGSVKIKAPHVTAYCVTKAALDHYTRGAALELAAHGVRVNTVSPGPVITDFFENAKEDVSMDDFAAAMPLKRCGRPEEIADLLLFLSSDKATSITGANYLSDNGFCL